MEKRGAGPDSGAVAEGGDGAEKQGESSVFAVGRTEEGSATGTRDGTGGDSGTGTEVGDRAVEHEKSSVGAVGTIGEAS